jgi:hypothetical protein
MINIALPERFLNLGKSDGSDGKMLDPMKEFRIEQWLRAIWVCCRELSTGINVIASSRSNSVD